MYFECQWFLVIFIHTATLIASYSQACDNLQSCPLFKLATIYNDTSLDNGTSLLQCTQLQCTLMAND